MYTPTPMRGGQEMLRGARVSGHTYNKEGRAGGVERSSGEWSHLYTTKRGGKEVLRGAGVSDHTYNKEGRAGGVKRSWGE